MASVGLICFQYLVILVPLILLIFFPPPATFRKREAVKKQM